MALYLENLNLGFLRGEEKAFMGMIGLSIEEGDRIVGYYGLPYLNKHFGDAQIVLRTAANQEGSGALEIVGVDAHAAGQAVWNCRVNGVDIGYKDADLLSKRVMVTRPDDSGGMAVVTLVNGDVLPSFLDGDTIRLQMIGFPEEIEYFKDENAYACTQPEDENGRKTLLSDGCVFPTGFMINRDPNDSRFESDEHLDELTHIRATVKGFRLGKQEFNGESHDAFVLCEIDTEFGPLQIVHTIDQVKKQQRKNMKAGAVVSFFGVLSGDPAIDEYENGFIRDEKHDLAALRFVFSGNDPERIRRILAEDCVYFAEYNTTTYLGPDAIIDRLKHVQKEHGEQYFAHLATVTSIDDGDQDLPFEIGRRCIVLASGEETNYESIAFIDVNDEGCVSRITTSADPRYHFTIDGNP